MGHWGSGPLDNDTAADWFYSLSEKPVTRLISDGLVSKDYDEVRAAAWLLIQIGYNYVYPMGELDRHKEIAVGRLKAMLGDKAWLSGWVNPKEISASIMAQIYKLGEIK